MDRFTISLDEELAAAFDELIKQRGYTARSEAVRDILRDLLQRRDQASDSCGFCVASLSYVYNHHERQLSDRLANLQHDHHDLTVATMHVHLDHEQCLETAALTGIIREFLTNKSPCRGKKALLQGFPPLERLLHERR